MRHCHLLFQIRTPSGKWQSITIIISQSLHLISYLMTDYINLCERGNLCNLFISQKELAAYEIRQMRAISARYISRVSFRKLCTTLVQQSERGSIISCNKSRHTSNLHRVSYSLMLCCRSVGCSLCNVSDCLREMKHENAAMVFERVTWYRFKAQ